MRPAIVLGTNLVVGGAALVWVLTRWGTPALALLARPIAPAAAMGFAGAAATALLLYAFRWRRVLVGVGGRSGLLPLVAFRAAGQSVSLLLPSARVGGDPLRAFLLARDGVAAPAAIASVAVDRLLEMAATAPFACAYGASLLRAGVPELQGAMVSVSLGAITVVAAIAAASRRLRRGAGLVTSLARAMRIDRLGIVGDRMHVLVDAEDAARRLATRPARMGRTFALGVAANVVVLVEYHFLLATLGLPAGALDVVAAIFAAGAAHSLPVPAAVGALEGAETWLFTTLGHPPEVGLAVALAVRLRELVWAVPGLVWLIVRGTGRVRPAQRTCAQTATARNPG